MEKKILVKLPFSSTSAINQPIITHETTELLLSMICDVDGDVKPINVLFIKPRAYRKRAEIYCTEWHIKDTYDAICEVKHSDWISELKRDAGIKSRNQWIMRHFMIYVDSFGCLEVIAESIQIN